MSASWEAGFLALFAGIYSRFGGIWQVKFRRLILSGQGGNYMTKVLHEVVVAFLLVRREETSQ